LQKRQERQHTETASCLEEDVVVVPEVSEEVEVEELKQASISVEVQTVECGPRNTQTVNSSCDPMTNKDPLLNIEQFKNNPSIIHDYTGLKNYSRFCMVLNTLGPAAYQLSYMYGHPPSSISVENQFFLVLIKLRKHHTNFELSTLFSISESQCYNIFFTWVRFMSLQWKRLPIWCSRDLVQFYSPLGFSAEYPTTRVIVDGTECPVQKPSFPTAQQSTFSTYKNRNTVKTLVGISPGGVTSFVSECYGGSTSDRQIVERSTLPSMCDPGDSVMSDKGFDVQDIFAPYGVKVNIPTFFKKRNRMDGEMVVRDRKIASKRVHVERIIGYAKTYKVLTQPLNSSETLLSSDIVFVCFMLCNFRAGVVPRHA